VIVITG